MTPELVNRTSPVEVRGYTSHNRPAAPLLRVLSVFLDVCLIFLLVLMIDSAFKIWPTPRLSLILILIATTVVYLIPQKKLLGLTLGERALLLETTQRQPNPQNDFFALNEPLYQRDYFGFWSTFRAAAVTSFCLSLTGLEFYRVVLTHPNWVRAPEWKLQGFVADADKDGWSISPFYYLLGGWPKAFQNTPVLYSLPYEVGPPSRFIGHVVAYWDHPSISVTFEGPKTPDFIGLKASVSELKDCFTQSLYSLRCTSIRETVLKRHIQDIQSNRQLRQWSLKWFEVENPLLPPEELPQGIYLHASGKFWAQDRFILVNSNGTHQVILLKRPNNEKGESAFELLQNAIGSLRNLNGLEPGRAWINEELMHTQLGDPSQLREVQQHLISKITVDPGDFASYFHLAGTSMMMAKAATYQGFQTKVAIENLESAQRYATDVSPADPRLGQIQNLESEMQKFLSR